MLYPAYNKVGRGNLVLRKHFVSRFQTNFSRHCVEWRDSIPSFCLGARAMKILINNDSFLQVGIETTAVALQSPLYPCAKTASIIFN